MSLPGCGDQTIHADTSHVFVHTHLPAHYVNMFLVALNTETGPEADYSIGQTAFVVGSHALDVSERVMTYSNGEKELKERLIRPHLTAGDALFFDCRILHFGLANQSNTVSLPVSHSAQSLYRECLKVAKLRSQVKSIKDIDTSFSELVRNVLLSSESDPEDRANSEKSSGDFSGSSTVEEVAAITTAHPRRRPLLYVNYHHGWFHDPKNWNDREKLFTDNHSC
jgi:hypothetical protein